MSRIMERLRADDGFGLTDAITIMVISLLAISVIGGISIVATLTSAQTAHQAQARDAIELDATALLQKANTQGVGSVKAGGAPVTYPALDESVSLTSWALNSSGAIVAKFSATTTSLAGRRTETATVTMPLTTVSQYTGASGSRQTWTSSSSSAPAIAYRVLPPVELRGESK
ncbi:hypothetical protein GCM10022286_00710 [Gryllotalpicola daejeonensis]|uniref:Type II secretion system protein n=1 Tax=Gryllotalpicola daejeonensis TaxID=993087 RepID=A0ABP7ZDU9_9MICO